MLIMHAVLRSFTAMLKKNCVYILSITHLKGDVKKNPLGKTNCPSANTVGCILWSINLFEKTTII